MRNGQEPGTAAGENRKAMVTTKTGRRLAYVEAGVGPDVLLVHGTLTTADDMRLALFGHLQNAFHVVAVDRPAHGASDHVPGVDASLWSQAETLRDATLALGLRRPIVCGHSYGGAVALAMALAYPDLVGSVVALAPICFPEPRLEHVVFGPRTIAGREAASWIDPLLLPILWNAMFLPQLMPKPFAGGFPFALAGKPSQIVAEGEGANQLPLDLVRSVSAYAGCRVPVHFLTGSADIVVNPLHSTFAASLVPNSRLRVLPSVGHMIHHARPEIVAGCITDLAGQGR
jgi:pimeloyl-ACP methyl ester carboxylesterase